MSELNIQVKTMAQLYNPETMPKGLKKAHEELDHGRRTMLPVTAL
jgi:hypothetical protein